MPIAAIRPYLTVGVALAGVGLAAVTPFAPVRSQAGGDSTDPEVSLTSSDSDFDVSDLLNIPVNLIKDIANIPYNFFEAPYSIKDPALIPNFSDNPDGLHDTDDPLPDAYNPSDYDGAQSELMPTYDGPDDGVFFGAINNLAAALDYTGTWSGGTPTNVWGWDTANPWNGTALINDLLPIKPLSEPLAENVNELFEAESPIADPANKFLMHDPLGEFAEQFSVPLDKLIDGYSFTGDDEAINPVGGPPGDVDYVGDGGHPYPEIWNGQTIHLDPSFGLDDYFDHLTDDPADNEVHPLDFDAVLPGIAHLLEGINADFNPLAPGTDAFLFQGAHLLYGLPALINGAVSGEHGLAPDSDVQIIPDDVTKAVGGVLDQVIGPDSGLAHTLVTANYQVEELFDDLLGDYLPDGVHFAPDDVAGVSDSATSPDEPGDAGSDAAAALLG